MEKKELRRTIGARAKQRRKSLKLPLQYVAEQMEVNKTTIQRYENGSIDNTKKLIVEGLADALHVSAAWLRGETEDMGADMSDSRDFKIESAMGRIMADFPLDMPAGESDFSKDLLLLFLYEYRMFNKSLAHASKEYGTGGDFNEAMSKVMGFESEQEFNNVMFLREIMRFINSTSEISDIVRVYAKEPELAKTRLKNLLSEHSL